MKQAVKIFALSFCIGLCIFLWGCTSQAWNNMTAGKTTVLPPSVNRVDGNTSHITIEIFPPNTPMPAARKGTLYFVDPAFASVPAEDRGKVIALEDLGATSVVDKGIVIEMPSGEKVRVPPGHGVRLRIDKDGGGSVTATGAGITTPDTKTASEFKSNPPTIDMRRGTVSAGAFAWSGEMGSLSDPRPWTPLILAGLGAIVILGSGVWFGIINKDWTHAILWVVVGVALVAVGALIEIYPWVLWLGLAAAVGVFVFWGIRSGMFKKVVAELDTTKTALTTVVTGVEQANPGPGGATKDKIMEVAEATGTRNLVVDTVRAVKADANL